MTFYILTLACVDHPSNEHKLQRDCMQKFLDMDFDRVTFEDLRERELITQDFEKDDLCQWSGITCINGLITSIDWDSAENNAYVDLQWLPSTLLDIVLWSKPLRGVPVNWRALPRDVHNLALVLCGLTGTIDTSVLPCKLQKVFLSYNKFTGTVKLIHLPPDIELIDIAWNSLTVIIAFHYDFPWIGLDVRAGDLTITWLEDDDENSNWGFF